MNDELYICIRNGNFMERKNGEYFISLKVTKKMVKKAMTEYLATNPSNISANSVIRESVLRASGCRYFKHFQTKSDNPNCKITYDDPLYLELFEFMKQDENYQKKIKSNAEYTQKRKEVREESLQKRIINQELNSFFSTERYKRVTRKR